VIDIPVQWAKSQSRLNGEAGRAFVAGLPDRAAHFLDRWGLRVTGPSMYGVCALVLPVERAGAGEGERTAERTAERAVLKLQPLDDETAGEPVALSAWNGDGAVRLLEYDAETGTLLLERLEAARDLSGVEIREAVGVVAGLLARLTAAEAPAGLRRTLGDLAARMLDDVPVVVPLVADAGERRLLRDCATALREVAGEPGDRLLHWDLHYENVLSGGREPWLAIDPKPLAGDPGFELLPALFNRFDASHVGWRFDLMTEVLGLDRERARAWTLGRVLQNGLWMRSVVPEHAAIARILLGK
jgi:streptomycin 6-kinase